MDDIKLDYSDVLMVPRFGISDYVSRGEIDLTTHKPFLVAANMDTIGTLSMAKALHPFNVITCLHKYIDWKDIVEYLKEDISRINTTWISIDMNKENVARAIALSLDTMMYPEQELVFCLDVANGYLISYQNAVNKFISELNTYCSHINYKLVVGNYISLPSFNRNWPLILKINIGSGSVCTTRKMTGIGYPAFSLTQEITNISPWAVCSDGGCTNAGDISKSLAAGAEYVMIGGMLAGHDECEGEIVEKEVDTKVEFDGKVQHLDKNRNLYFSGYTYTPVIEKKMKFYGMASKQAVDKYNGGLRDYRTAEGKEVLVPYKGPVSNTIKDILGGIRSTMTYCGAESPLDIKNKVYFIKVNNQLNNVFKN